tara:strand:- start:65 stop:1504 length:1440 start_codon:yes stop_codon:yes gene_type:complete
MKIAFLNPGVGFQQPPLALGYLASYAKKYVKGDIDIKIFDEAAGDDLIKECKDFNPDLVGLTASTPLIKRAIQISKELKAINPNIKIFAGGTHITAIPASVKNFDLGFIGEGEETLVEVINTIKKGGDIKSPHIKGICFEKDGKIIANERRPFIEDVNSIPPPARDLMNMKYYIRPKETVRGIIGKATQIMASRGCHWNCSYCSNNLLWKRQVRFFSPSYVVQEMKNLIDKYKLDLIYFQDDNFSVNDEWLTELCNLMIESGVSKNVLWSVQCRVDCITKEKLELMKKAGCIRIEFGLESGSKKILEYYNKDTDLKKAREAIALCKEVGLHTLGNFVIGAPIETEEDIIKTRNFYKENKLSYVSPFIITPLPGTKLYNDFKSEYGLNEEKQNWDTFYVGLNSDNIVISKKISNEKLHQIYEEIAEETEQINSKPLNIYTHRNISDNWFYFNYMAKKKARQVIPQAIMQKIDVLRNRTSS